MTNSTRRAPVIVVVTIAIAAAFVVGPPTVQLARSRSKPAVNSAPAVLASGSVRSSAWYCAMAAPDGHSAPGDGIIVSNFTSEIVPSDVTAISRGIVVGRKHIDVVGHGSARVALRELTRDRDAAIVVEAFAAGIVVEHTASSGPASAATPCATESNSRWTFAAGTTRRGSTESIAIANPFGQNAIVDISLVTSQGSVSPDSMQSLEIGARSRVAVNINGGADQREVVAVEIVARGAARVVAELALGSPQPTIAPGARRAVRVVGELSLMVGSPTGSKQWHLVDVDGSRLLQHRVVVFNPTDAPLPVSLQTLLSGQSAVQQTDVVVDARAVMAIDPLTRNSRHLDASVIVFSNTAEFVVGDLVTPAGAVSTGPTSTLPASATSAANAVLGGASVASASATLARRSVFAFDRVTPGDVVSIVIENASEHGANIDVRAGSESVSRHLTIRANERMTIVLAKNTISVPLSVESDQPVYVGRRIAGTEGITRTVGIPEQ